jgi:hypothetical protein
MAGLSKKAPPKVPCGNSAPPLLATCAVQPVKSDGDCIAPPVKIPGAAPRKAPPAHLLEGHVQQQGKAPLMNPIAKHPPQKHQQESAPPREMTGPGWTGLYHATGKQDDTGGTITQQQLFVSMGTPSVHDAGSDPSMKLKPDTPKLLHTVSGLRQQNVMESVTHGGYDPGLVCACWSPSLFRHPLFDVPNVAVPHNEQQQQQPVQTRTSVDL